MHGRISKLGERKELDRIYRINKFFLHYELSSIATSRNNYGLGRVIIYSNVPTTVIVEKEVDVVK